MVDLIWKDLFIPGITVLLTSLGAWLSVNWVNNRKTSAEIERMEISNDSLAIANLEKSFNVQSDMIDAEREYNKKLKEEQDLKFEELLNTVNDTNAKVKYLTSVVESLMEVSCLDNNCTQRKGLSCAQTRALITGTPINLKDETKSKKNI